MARGERSSPERTRADREQARAERERRRAERAGLPAPVESPALESDPDAAPAPVEPQWLEGEAGATAHAEWSHLAGDPIAAPQPEAVVPAESEPAAEAIEAEPEMHSGQAEPERAESPAGGYPSAGEPEAAEPEAVEHAPDWHAGEHAAEPEPIAPVPAVDAADADQAAGHGQDLTPEEQRPGYAIPGLPEPPGPPPREALPDPPRRMRAAEPMPMRRAFRRGGEEAGAAGAAALASEGRSVTGGRRRDGSSRWIALVALLAIGVVVALILYSLSRSSSHATAKAPPAVKVLIPEGKTRLQIAQIASAAGLTGSYRRAARSSPLLNPAQYGAPKGTSTLEGFLFPATYDMDKGAPSQRLVEEQLTAFQENFSAEFAKRAKDLGLTPYELLTVASMIEREAKLPSDRAKIAAVIYNRLKAGIPLGVDATIYYAVENAENIPTYTKELTTSQLQMSSAYNTRVHKGLPPTPISNPGLASIQAAAHPAHVSYMYYVEGADGCGEQVFSTTEAKFDEDVAAYEAAKRANGGQLPACKRH